MSRISFIAVSGSSLLLALTLTPTALATADLRVASRASVSASTFAGQASNAPKSRIKGNPAHWVPSKLYASGREPHGASCSKKRYVSFWMKNKENVSEHVTIRGTNGLNRVSTTIKPHSWVAVCVTYGYVGTDRVTLPDGKKLKVRF